MISNSTAEKQRDALSNWFSRCFRCIVVVVSLLPKAANGAESDRIAGRIRISNLFDCVFCEVLWLNPQVVWFLL